MPLAVRVEAGPFDGLSNAVGQRCCDREDHLDGRYDEAARDPGDEAESPV
jgi:hypothetical protein